MAACAPDGTFIFQAREFQRDLVVKDDQNNKKNVGIGLTIEKVHSGFVCLDRKHGQTLDFIAPSGLEDMSWVSLDGRHRDIFIGATIGLSLAISSASIAAYVHSLRQRRDRGNPEPEFSARPIELRSDEIVDGVSGLIGHPNLCGLSSSSD